MTQASDVDVAIIGGGPGGSTTGALLAKYRPELRVTILERAVFPRDHVGESQLPPLSEVLDEMGCWDQVEAEGFPIKIGATYRWGSSEQLWDFEFLPIARFRDEPRPAKFEGQRKLTAFQVERARYDEILLNQAKKLGCEVRQGTSVDAVRTENDRVTALELASGETITAKWYVDASGHSGRLRRALKVPTEVPTRLKNIAIWDYWENAEWAVEIGVGGTRVQVMSQRYGWLWFIPLSPTRTSIGLVCPAEYYKSQSLDPEKLYLTAVEQDPRLGPLTKNAKRRGQVETTKDWSFVSSRAQGPNWLLVGEACGFADPILAAGMTLAQVGAREAAYTLLALLSGAHPADWLLSHYERNQLNRIRQHIRFADFWYASNGQFQDLQEHCRAIAKEAGLTMSAEDAWAWLAQGGFTVDVLGQSGIGGLDLAGVKQISQRFTAGKATWQASKHNVFQLNRQNLKLTKVPFYRNGAVHAAPALQRGDQVLLLVGMFALVAKLSEQSVTLAAMLAKFKQTFAQQLGPANVPQAMHHAVQALEVMLSEGWLEGTLDPNQPTLVLDTPEEGQLIHTNDDGSPR